MDNKFIIPGAILAGALIIAGAVVYGDDIKERMVQGNTPSTKSKGMAMPLILLLLFL